jgi:hypothetical protein
MVYLDGKRRHKDINFMKKETLNPIVFNPKINITVAPEICPGLVKSRPFYGF